ncbi:MAG: M20/M25/M40 family metallo-hydrolase [Firmicutes bacterium]|nr:M20/M25/M40 family metallo-hydrolase [Bacillota bacterium]MBQ4371652.1 M20/M25/M40 family metallo-hydrolase [Bacillota bacterium]
MKEKIQKLRESAKFQKALAFIETDGERTLDQQIELALIPSFSNHEENKAARFREMIEELGYETVQDEVCNTFAVIPGPEGSPVVMVSAHLDTVFPLETPLELRREGSRVYLPGICDDTRGCAEVLAMLRAMKEADIKPACTLYFGGDSGEEGLGNFRGMRHIFNTKGTKVDAFISVDGAGSNLTYGGVSDVQYKITFRGPGGHSMGAFGLVNPVMAMSRAIAKIAEQRVPTDPFTIFNTSLVGGGTGVTSIASECWFTMDVRSASADVMREFHERCLRICRECADEEYERWADMRAFYETSGKELRFDPNARIEVSHEELSGSIGGVQDENCEIVSILKAAFEASGVEPTMRSLSSTDANIPLSLGIPAATISCGGVSGNTHDVSEWYDPTDSYIGVQKNLLCVLALTGIEGVAEPLISKTQTK